MKKDELNQLQVEDSNESLEEKVDSTKEESQHSLSDSREDKVVAEETKPVQSQPSPSVSQGCCNKTNKSRHNLMIVVGLGICLIAIIGIGLGKQQKPLDLTQLIETPYEVEYELSDENHYEIELVVDESDDVIIEIVSKMAQAVADYNKEAPQLAIEVYRDEVETDLKGDFQSPNQTHAIVVDKQIKVTTMLEMGDLEANVLATDNWNIFNSHYDEEGNLLGSVLMTEEVSEEVIFQQLKGIASEMARFNEVEEDKHLAFDTIMSSNVVYQYHSKYPTLLFKTTEYAIQVESKMH